MKTKRATTSWPEQKPGLWIVLASADSATLQNLMERFQNFLDGKTGNIPVHYATKTLVFPVKAPENDITSALARDEIILSKSQTSSEARKQNRTTPKPGRKPDLVIWLASPDSVSAYCEMNEWCEQQGILLKTAPKNAFTGRPTLDAIYSEAIAIFNDALSQKFLIRLHGQSARTDAPSPFFAPVAQPA